MTITNFSNELILEIAQYLTTPTPSVLAIFARLNKKFHEVITNSALWAEEKTFSTIKPHIVEFLCLTKNHHKILTLKDEQSDCFILTIAPLNFSNNVIGYKILKKSAKIELVNSSELREFSRKIILKSLAYKIKLSYSLPVTRCFYTKIVALIKNHTEKSEHLIEAYIKGSPSPPKKSQRNAAAKKADIVKAKNILMSMR